MAAKLLTLDEWASEVYGNHPPAMVTLRRWARECRIWPAPKKHGRAYFVQADARYADPNEPPPAPESPRRSQRLIDRVRADGAKA